MSLRRRIAAFAPEQLGPTSSVRVMQVVLSLSPGGTERLVIELSRRLRDAHGMHICCLDEPGAWADEIRSCGVLVESLGRSPGFSPILGLKIARLARRVGAQVLHCHQYSPFVYGTLARMWRRVGLVFTEHGRLADGPPSRRRTTANRFLGRVPAEIFCVSEDLRRHLHREGIPLSRVGVIHNGIRIRPLEGPEARVRARTELGVPLTARLFGTVGRLDPVKDLQSALKALHEMADPEAWFVLVGDGPDRSALASLAGELGIKSRVIFTGYRSDVRALLPALDVYICSSIFEGVSLTILEAMAGGLPVVATAVGGNPEVVIDGETGMLVEPRNPVRLAQAMRGMAHCPERCRQLGEAGRRRVEKHFSLDHMVARYAEVYRRFEDR